MNLAVLYLLLLKATATAFSGLSSLPILHDDLVVKRHVLTDRHWSSGNRRPALWESTWSALDFSWRAFRAPS